MTFQGYAAVLLAAGLSSRHKSGHKLTRIWRGKPLIQHSINTLRTLSLSQLVVVLGKNADEIEELVDLEGFSVIRNANPEDGLSQSLRLGVSALDKSIAASFIALADMPLVNAETYMKLASAFTPSQGKTICTPEFEGRMANPVLFGRQWFENISQIKGDKGARAIIKAESNSVATVRIDNEGVITDFDEDGDFERS